ncbi:MAG: DNA-directed RNA polymerase subunit alpha C-terminal domain-containing protein [Planctomycetota bacterium]|nr:DNA-directed RNA polymerase subunit alpha C-terminal domain-containing protein [Planctomycetota bacterium]
MSEIQIVDLREIFLSNSSFGPREIEEIKNEISGNYAQFSVLKEVIAEMAMITERTPASSVKLGVAYYILGNYHKCTEALTNADSGAVANFYLGKAYFALEDYPKAIAAYEASTKGGYDKDLCNLGIVEAMRYSDQVEPAMEILDQMFGSIEQTAEYRYQRGATVAAVGGNPQEVVALYEKAIELDPGHPGALFGLGLENDRRGNDEMAISLYQRAASVFPTNVGSLLNLGLLYEDLDQNEQARRCYERILDVFPSHERARLYLRDAMASGDEWDYNKQKEEERIRNVLKTPVTDFELSVRSRNCLENMGINALGDLTKISESELLSSKNFGETSLVEIREMLSAKGLRIGQHSSESVQQDEPVDTSHLTPDEQALLDRPISDLNLSVRARKCMNRLGMANIGELIRKSGDDLLECKNFGVTSLNEIREKLEQAGLKLRGD